MATMPTDKFTRIPYAMTIHKKRSNVCLCRSPNENVSIEPVSGKIIFDYVRISILCIILIRVFYRDFFLETKICLDLDVGCLTAIKRNVYIESH